MNIPEIDSLKKSSTHSYALPNISKINSKPSYLTTRANTTRHHSVFFQKVKDLTKQSRYDQMQTQNINKQQKQLKILLKQFNKQTFNVLNQYIDRPADVRSARASKQRTTSSSIIQLKQKQIINSQQALQICKREMQMLQKKCEYLKYITVQDFQKNIDSIKVQIESLKVKNKQITKGNTLRGLNIHRNDGKVNNDVSQIEMEISLLERKRDKLNKDAKEIEQQDKKLKQNHLKADEKVQSLVQQFNRHDKQDKQIKQNKDLQRVYSEKKREFSIKKQKLQGKSSRQSVIELSENKIQNQQIMITKITQNQQSKTNNNLKPEQVKVENKNRLILNSKNQYQYLKLLKQLQEIIKRTKQQQERILSLNQKVETSRKQIATYQHVLLNDKKQQKQSKLKQSIKVNLTKQA